MANNEYVDIQKKLGKEGEIERKFECYLYTSRYSKYKYRLFFVKYGIASYPVRFTLEESIAQSIKEGNSYIITCNNREEIEELLLKILYSKKVIGIMQELIRVYQSDLCQENIEEVDDTIEEE